MLLDRYTFYRGFIVLVAAMIAGVMFGSWLPMSPNDRARWDTVWSLVDFNTYQIFDTKAEAEKWGKPEQWETIDKVARKFPGPDGKEELKFYSSKPPLLPTVAAGVVKGMQYVGKAMHVLGPSFHHLGGPITKEDRGKPTVGNSSIYFKPTMMLFNLVPFLIFLGMYRRHLDRETSTDFAWYVCIIVAALGSLSTGYLTTFNNHSIAAHFAGMTLLLLWPIWHDGRRDAWRFALAGLCAGWTAANELPAAAFALACLVFSLSRAFLSAFVFFLPPFVLVVWAFFYTNEQSFGSKIPAYLQPEMYDYPDSYWRKSDKSAIDALSTPREDGTYVEGPRVAGEFTRNIKSFIKPEAEGVTAKPSGLFVSPRYLMHMTFGHHGLFSMTPIWIFAFIGLFAALFEDRGWRLLSAWMLFVIVLVTFAFYWMVNTERNYGGFCHGMRWLLWLTPIWLLYLPRMLDALSNSRFGRMLVWIAVGISIFSVADTWPNPWHYSWLHRILIWCGAVGY